MGELYRYTLEEYKQMVRERDDLLNMEDRIWALRRDVTYRGDGHLCRTFLAHWKEEYSELEDPDSGWQGADADAYLSTAREIHDDLSTALDDYLVALKQTEDKIRERIDDLIWRIADCEEHYNMTLGGNIVVQTADAFGFEVK